MAVKKLPARPKSTASDYAHLNVRRFKVEELQPAEYNARVITDAALKGLQTSLQRFGVLSLPVVNVRPDGVRIVSGHQRVELLSRAGVEEIDCIAVQFDDATERQANFTMNNPAIEGRFVPELTRGLIERIRELEDDAKSLVEPLRLDALVKRVVREAESRVGVDDVVALGRVSDDEQPNIGGRTTAVSKTGCYYQLGEHRVYCGKLAHKGSLTGFGVNSAAMSFSRLDSHEPFAPGYLDTHIGHVIDNTQGCTYIATNTERMTQVIRAFQRAGGHFSDVLLAIDSSAAPAKSQYRDATQPIVYGWKRDGLHPDYGDRTAANLFRTANAFPKSDVLVETVTRHILNSTRRDEVVLDVSGAGGVLIACEKTKRRYIGYVANPRDMDRLRSRWTTFIHGSDANWKALTQQVTA